jgi:hypothetical protein
LAKSPRKGAGNGAGRKKGADDELAALKRRIRELETGMADAETVRDPRKRELVKKAVWVTPVIMSMNLPKRAFAQASPVSDPSAPTISPTPGAPTPVAPVAQPPVAQPPATVPTQGPTTVPG